MGEALITRRGTVSGRFATGKVTINSATNTFAVSGLKFQPKDIKIFRLDGSYVNTVLWSLLWKASLGIYGYRLEAAELLEASVTTRADGFTIVDNVRSHRFVGNYYWFAFEKEQEV